MVVFYRFSQREIEPGIVSNVLVEAAGQAQSPPPRDTEPVAPPRRRSLKETSFDAEVGTQLALGPACGLFTLPDTDTYGSFTLPDADRLRDLCW